MAAHTALYQPGQTSQDIERFLSFMADDISDYHAAYGVTLKGKDVYRKSVPDKIKTAVSYAFEIGSLIIGKQTAVVAFKEHSVDKSGDKAVAYEGRTLLVIEFNQQGKIGHLRRYMDW